MRIVNVIQRYSPAVGGAETWCREVSRQLVGLGHEVSVLTLDIIEEEEFWRDPQPEQRQLRLGPIDVDGGVQVRRYRRSIPNHTVYHALYKWLLDRGLGVYFYGPHSLEMYLKMGARIREADAVLLHTIPYPHNTIAQWIAHVLGKPTFVIPYFHPGHPFYERDHHYRLMKAARGLFVLSEHERETIAAHGVDSSRIVTTGCGVDEASFRESDPSRAQRTVRERFGIPPSQHIVLFLGRKIEQKGVGMLLDACEKLADHREIALLLAGPSTDWFRAWWDARPQAKPGLRVLDLGEVSDAEKVELLQAADLMVLPSEHESFGIVYLEAWAAGTPVVGCDGGAVPSVLGEGGLTVPYGDAAALSGAVERVLSSPSLSRSLVDAGRERIRTRYRWNLIGETMAHQIAARAKHRLRVLHVSNLFPPYFIGGAEIIAQRHARALASRNHEIRVFAGRLDPRAPRYAAVRERQGPIKITRVALRLEDLSAEERNHDRPEIAQLFGEMLDEWRPDVVHVHNLAGLGVEIIERSRNEGIPVVMTLHDYWAICPKNTMTRNDGSLCARNGPDCSSCLPRIGSDLPIHPQRRNAEVLEALSRVSRFTAPSHYLAGRYRESGLRDREIEVLSYGVDSERLHRHRRRRRGPCRLGYNGYVGDHKGISVLLEAMTHVYGARLTLRGPCEEPDRVRRRIADLGLAESVELAAPLSNDKIPRVLARQDVAVLPSVWPDNHPVSILEAMATGLPVVATHIGGIPEMVRDGETGFLVEPRDAVAMADRIQRLVDDPDLGESMGEAGRRVACEEYDGGRAIDALENLYRDAMAFPDGHRGDAHERRQPVPVQEESSHV